MQKQLVIIEAPSNLGLKDLVPGKEPGVRRLPEHLKKYGLYEQLGTPTVIRVEAPPYQSIVDPVSDVRNADMVAAYSKELATVLTRILQQNQLPLVIGGDCSILLGAGAALKSIGNYGLFYLDGHTDYVWPEQSQTAAAAGMDLAIVTGNGHPKLTDIDHLKPYFNEPNVYAVGNREFDPDYVALIANSDIHYYPLPGIRNEGTAVIAGKFLQMVEFKGLSGFWIHLDVDVLDDVVMPCVDSRENGGLSYAELSQMLTPLITSPLFCGIEITILDPSLDPAGEYALAFIRHFTPLFKPYI